MAEGDIIDSEEVDRDTVNAGALEEHFSKKYKLLAETAVSPNKTYVNKLHGSKLLKLAVSLSDNSIEVYELNKTSLNRVCHLSGHKELITELVFSPKEDNLVYSSGQDGVIRLWDTRSSGTCALEYKDEDDQIKKQYECMDVSCNGRVVCAGTQMAKDDAYLVFWDNRSTKPLGGYWNSHTDDISQVKFHKKKTEVLASGSLDGLLNIYNILEPTEDDALTYSLNVENSIEKISWLGEKQAAVITQSNDLQVWDIANGDLVNSFSRDKVARSIKRSRGDDCYLVDVLTTADEEPLVLAGSYGGDGKVLRSVSMAGSRLQPATNFTTNKQIVRCCWYDQHREVLVTAGESGLLSVWSPSGEDASAAPAAAAAAAAHKVTTAIHKLHVNRYKPY